MESTSKTVKIIGFDCGSPLSKEIELLYDRQDAEIQRRIKEVYFSVTGEEEGTLPIVAFSSLFPDDRIAENSFSNFKSHVDDVIAHPYGNTIVLDSLNMLEQREYIQLPLTRTERRKQERENRKREKKK